MLRETLQAVLDLVEPTEGQVGGSKARDGGLVACGSQGVLAGTSYGGGGGVDRNHTLTALGRRAQAGTVPLGSTRAVLMPEVRTLAVDRT